MCASAAEARLPAPAAALRELERLTRSGGPAAAASKRALIQRLARTALTGPRQVLRLHETLCFLRAYPDDAALLEAVERALDGFARRRDVARHRAALEDTGIAGADIRFAFYFATARWLWRRFPGQLRVDWPRFDERDRLHDVLELLLPSVEHLAVEGSALSWRALIDALRGPGETDAAFLLGRFEALRADFAVRERLYEDLAVPLRLSTRGGWPSRTASRLAVDRPAFGPPPRDWRPADGLRLPPPPRAVRAVRGARAERLVDLAKVQMITRGRDLYAFMHADANDVRVVEFPGCVQFLGYGLAPAHRLVLETLYVFVILRNGVPVGYTQATVLFRSAEVNFNVFDTFRGAEASRLFRYALSMIRHLFGADAFVVNTQQLGDGNEEAIDTGAWWFYHKHGFRPRDPTVRRIARREVGLRRRDPRHRSSRAVLRRLAGDNVYRHLGRERRHTVSTVDTSRLGLAVAAHVARRFGSDRESADRACQAEAMERLGLASLAGFTAAERLAWRWWSPLIALLPDIEGWPRADRDELVRVVRAKGGAHESDYVYLLDRHRRLSRALLGLVAPV